MPERTFTIDFFLQNFSIKELLEETTRVKQLERQEKEAELTQKTYYKVPYPIYIA